MSKFALIERRYIYLIRIIVYVITGFSSIYSVPLSNGGVTVTVPEVFNRM